MERKIWQTLDRFAGLGCILMLFALLIAQANLEVKDLDLWLHLRTGQYIVETRTIPQQDIYSFTLAGKDWVNHEWLFQVLAYLSYHFGGADGLIRMQVAVVIITLLILFFMGFEPLKRNYFAVALPLLFVLLVYRSRFTIRPDIFSLMFFAFYLLILHKHLEKKWILYALPLTQILWCNMHGFFFLGILLLFIAVGAEFIKRHFRLPWDWNKANNLSDEAYRRLKLTFGLTVLAALANPYTLNGFIYPFRVMFQLAGESRIFFIHIQELKPALNLTTLFLRDGSEDYKAIIFISFVSCVLNARRLDLGRLVIWIIFLISSLAAIRNIAYFSFVAYFVYMYNQKYIFPLRFFSLRFNNLSIKYITRIVLKVAFIIWVAAAINKLGVRWYYDFEKYAAKGILGGVSSRDYPKAAAEFILENNITGNVFNDFNSGAFLIGRCFPQIKVFIDGRTEMYGPRFFESYRKILAEDPKPFDEIAKRYNIRAVVLSGVHHPIDNRLLVHLYNSQDWKMVALDPFAVVFLKEADENRALIKRFAIDLANWQPPEVDLKKIGATAVYPYPNINRAQTLEALGLDSAVINEAKAALRIMPNCAAALRFLGKAYKKQGKWEEAFENLRLAAVYREDDLDSKIDLAEVCRKLGDIAAGIKQLEQIIVSTPKFSRPYYYLALFLAERDDRAGAEKALTKAFRLKPPGAGDLLWVADGLFKAGYFSEAAQIFQRAIKINEKSAYAHARLGLCYIRLKKYPDADRELTAALGWDPDLVIAHIYFGELYARQGQGEEAKAEWQKALKLDPRNKTVRENIKQFVRGEFNG
ncbi:MAG: tetratricopeptide repeat protein [Candidatus Omnitrophota bacterium]